MGQTSINLLIGVAAGFFGGLIGVGGGIVMIPLMVGVLKMKQHMAHGTSLVALVFTGLSGAITYALNGSVDIIAAVLLAPQQFLLPGLGQNLPIPCPKGNSRYTLGVF